MKTFSSEANQALDGVVDTHSERIKRLVYDELMNDPAYGSNHQFNGNDIKSGLRIVLAKEEHKNKRIVKVTPAWGCQDENQR